mgnify:CR=1 FL=1
MNLWDFVIALLVMPLLLLAWLMVQWAARRMAAAYPEFGPAREEGGGCGTSCGCSGGSCNKEN